MRLVVIGAGYVGLVTGTCFAEMGHHVICVDLNEEKIEGLARGIVPIYEPSLEEMVERNIQGSRLHFTTSYPEALKNAAVCFVAVATPSKEDGSCDLTQVFSAVDTIIESLNHPLIIVVKSTVAIGTTELLQQRIRKTLHRQNKTFSVAVVSNPEFLKEGSAVQDCLKPDRIIIGSNNPKATKVLRSLYASFTVNHDRILEMEPSSAELTKYAANAMLATRISFMNELANFCESVGANIGNVRIGIGADSRIGYHFLYPGLGWGGSCFPKDIRSLIHQAEMMECQTPILKAVEAINNHQKKVLFNKIQDYFSDKQGLKNKTIAIWGLSFKPNTDDIREAPSLQLIIDLLEAGAFVRCFDPIAMDNARKVFAGESKITFCKNEYETVDKADAIALVTEWKQFRSVNFTQILSLMRGRAFFDGRNQYLQSDMAAIGLEYFCIGMQPKRIQALIPAEAG